MLAQPYTAVVLNGTLAPAARLLPLLDRAEAVVAADGAANWLLAHGRLPQWVVGDLDSITPETLAAIEVAGCHFERHHSHKDETDGELALLRALALGARSVLILGALGGRVDHALGNLGLLAMPSLQEAQAVIYDGCAWLWLIAHEALIEGAPGDTLSLVPWGGDVEDVSTEGLAYPLRGEPLRMGAARGVSNLLTAARARVWLTRGRLLVIYTPQADLEAHDG